MSSSLACIALRHEPDIFPAARWCMIPVPLCRAIGLRAQVKPVNGLQMESVVCISRGWTRLGFNSKFLPAARRRMVPINLHGAIGLG